MKKSNLSELFINIGGGLTMSSTLLFWGGLFGLELPDAPSFGYIRIQDIISVFGIGTIFFGIMIRSKISSKAIQCILLFLCWVAYGIIVGFLNNNIAVNIGYEARAQIYALLGAIVGSIVSKNRIRSFLLIISTTLASAILIQWTLALSGSDFTLISGTNLGNIFTLNIPLVRPAAGFHIVGLGFFLMLTPWSESALLVLSLLGAAVLIAQSKTYWILSAIAFFLGPLAKKRSRIFGLVKNGIIGIFVIILATLIFNLAGSSGNVSVSPLQKFTDLIEDPNVQYGVIGKRQVELDYVFSSMKENIFSIPFGYGLGYSYRNSNLLFYRADTTDQERLSLFIHNYPVWVLLKYGVFGICFISILLFYVYRGMRKGDIYQKQFGLVLFLLFIGSSVMGTFEDPATAFLFGLLTIATIAGQPSLPVDSRVIYEQK